MISPCLSDVSVNAREGFRVRLVPLPAALEKRSSLLYNIEILILSRLCATDCQKGKSRSTLHFSFLVCFPVLSTCSAFSLLNRFLIFIITSLFFSNVLLSSSVFFVFLFFPSLPRAVLSAKPHALFPVLGVTSRNQRMKFPPREGKGRCRNPGISQSVRKKLQRCKISSVFSIKAPKAILRVRQKEGSHDN